MTTRPAIPRGIWILGFVSLLMDVSSEMIHGLLPVYSHREPGCERARGGDHRGRGGIDGAHREGLLGHALGSLAQPAGHRRGGLRPRGVLQAALRARDGTGAGVRGALPRPHRQGHPRRAARRADRRPRPAGNPRRRVRAAPDAGHRGRLRRPAHRDRPDARVERRLPRRVLGGGDPGRRVVRAHRVRRARAATFADRPQGAGAHRPRHARVSRARLLGRRPRRARLSRSRASARPSSCCAQPTSGSISRSLPSCWSR